MKSLTTRATRWLTALAVTHALALAPALPALAGAAALTGAAPLLPTGAPVVAIPAKAKKHARESAAAKAAKPSIATAVPVVKTAAPLPPATVPATSKSAAQAPTPAPAAPRPAPPAQTAAVAPAAEPAPVPVPDPPTPPLPVPGRSAPAKSTGALPVIAAVSQDPRPSVHPDVVRLTAEAAQRYAALAAQGGWQPLPADAALTPGIRSPLLPLLRYRLAAEGDLAGGDLAGEVYDPGVTAAVRRFQGRYGLKQTGAVGPATLKAMNVSAGDRARQLSATVERLGAAELPAGGRYVAVNIPSATVEAVQDGRVERRYVAVVGDPDHPSPTVEARIGAINFNPTWTVPTSIIRNEIIPKMRKDPGYLAKNRIRILDPAGTEIDPARIDWSTENAVNFTLRQDPGAGNSLGIVRIAMPNRYSVYMHDTPSKGHFGRDMRFLSHGCVRVAEVLDLVTWLLGPSGWNREQVDAAVASQGRLDIRLPQAVPVVWVYMTGFATPDGMVHFRDDVYGRDGLGGDAGRLAER